MTAIRSTIVAVVCLAAAIPAACARGHDGTPTAADVGPRSSVSSTTASSTTDPTTTDSRGPAFGVVPTTRVPVAANTVTCAPPEKPPVATVAQVADPVAPEITIGVPTGWSMQAGSGDVGTRLNGPDGMSATVTIAATALEPADAFDDYADRMMGQSAVSSISVLPAELCEYSGQKLLGARSDTPQNAVKFVDRIVHVWTGGRSYLVSVHTEAPTGTPGFDAAADELAGDFEVRIP